MDKRLYHRLSLIRYDNEVMTDKTFMSLKRAFFERQTEAGESEVVSSQKRQPRNIQWRDTRNKTTGAPPYLKIKARRAIYGGY